MTEHYNYKFKCIVVGDAGVGKSCYIRRLAKGVFDSLYQLTVGVELEFITCHVFGKKIRVQIWDTAGSERFHSIMRSYYRDCCICALVFDKTSKSSFDSISNKWQKDIVELCDPNVTCILVGNKCDMKHDIEVTREEGEALAKTLDCPYVEVSAKSGKEVEHSFRVLLEKMVDKMLVLSVNEQDKLRIERGLSEKTYFEYKEKEEQGTCC